MATKAIFVGINKHVFKLLTIPRLPCGIQNLRMAPLYVSSPLAETVISGDLGSTRRRVDSLDTV
jgi:hypothetical protein